MDPILIHAAICLAGAVMVLLAERWAHQIDVRAANADRLRHLILVRKVRG